MPVGWRQEEWPLPEGVDTNAVTYQRNTLLHSIGNLTLATQKLNSSMSNAPWTNKRSELQEHSVLLLQRVVVYALLERGDHPVQKPTNGETRVGKMARAIFSGKAIDGSRFCYGTQIRNIGWRILSRVRVAYSYYVQSGVGEFWGPWRRWAG